MSPYQQEVMDTTLSEFDRQQTINQQGLRDSAISAGAYGGGREGVMQSQFMNQGAMNRAQLQAQLLNQGHLCKHNNQQEQILQQDKVLDNINKHWVKRIKDLHKQDLMHNTLAAKRSFSMNHSQD